MQDLRDVQPFVMTRKNAHEYRIDYLGEQQVDEIETYMFSVKPKKIEKGKRYFEGQVWVDKIDLQIVKTYGKGVGHRKKNDDEQFPGSKPTATRSTANTGFRSTPAPGIRCNSKTARSRCA